METSIDSFGRIVIPKKIREHFLLDSGTQLRIEETADAIVLRPVFGEPNLNEKNGVLVYSGTLADDIEEATEKHRLERIHSLSKEHEVTL